MMSVSWRSDELDIRCGRENQDPERLGPQAPGWTSQENGKVTLLWPIEWGSICCSSVRSPAPSLSKTFSNPFEPFQIKWEVHFSKELCRSSLLCRRYDSACRCICIMWLCNNLTRWKVRHIILLALNQKKISFVDDYNERISCSVGWT